MAPASKRVIALDTNMLLAMEKFRIDVFEEIRRAFGSRAIIAVPEAVKKEVEKIAAEKNVAARIAVEALKKERVKIIKTKAKNADDALIELARKNAVIATNDSQLRKKIRGFGGMLVFLRKKKLLEISGG